MSSGSDNPDPPGAVSNQNQEEAEAAHAEEAKDGAGNRAGDASPDDSADSTPGAASEGSQATGHPDNAG